MLEKLHIKPHTDHPNIPFTILRIAIGLALVIPISGGEVSAQSPDTQLVSFNDFLANTRAARASDFVSQANAMRDSTQTTSDGTAGSGPTMMSDAAFEEMRQAILDRYTGVEVTHSFMVANELYDCVWINEQPAVRKYHITQLARPPPSLGPVSQQNQALVEGSGSTLQPPSGSDFDAFGNSTHCEMNTVPLLRPSLATMSHFRSLKDFYTKRPSLRQAALLKSAVDTTTGSASNTASLSSRSQPNASATVPVTYKGAYMVQEVDNLGGSAAIDVVTPAVNPAAGQVMSTSETWFEGGEDNTLQTVEVGLAVYPKLFGDAKAHFFIYSTPDNYQTGCFNNSCDDFIQVSPSGLLGQELPLSTNPDAASTILVTFVQSGGNWWLIYGSSVIGYYPKEIFNSGRLTKNAQRIARGTEGAGSTSWPEEGNGCLANSTECSAAFQANLQHFNLSGGMVTDNLSPITTSSASFNTDGPFPDDDLHGYFFVGGSGGTHLQ